MGRSCNTCALVSGTSSVTINDYNLNTHGGNCKTTNIIYAATCKLCVKKNVYVGKSENELRKRINEHRKGFKVLCKLHNSSLSPGSASSLAAHLSTVHKVQNNSHFNVSFKLDILYKLPLESKKSLREYEKIFIEKLQTITYGLNRSK